MTEDEGRGSRPPERVLDGNSMPLAGLGWAADGRSISAMGVFKAVTLEVAAQDSRFALNGSEETAQSASPPRPRPLADSPWGSRPGAEREGPMSRSRDDSGKVLFRATDPAFEPSAGPVYRRDVSLSHDGGRLAYWAYHRTGIRDKARTVGRFRVWDVASGREVFRHDVELEGTRSVQCFPSPDGRRLVTTTSSANSYPRGTSLSAWDLETGRETPLLARDEALPVACGFSPDGLRLAVAFLAGPPEDGTAELRVWDTATAREVVRVRWNGGNPRALAFRPTAGRSPSRSRGPTRGP